MASRPHRRARAMRRHRRRCTGALWLFVSLAVVLPLTVRGGRQRVPEHAGSWMPAARVGSSACGLFSRGRWVERADGPASCPHPQRVPRLRVCRTPCLGSVLHAHKLLHQFLAARPCPAGALRSASSVASAFVSVSSSSGAHHVGIRLQAALSSPPRAAPAARGKGRLNFPYSFL